VELKLGAPVPMGKGMGDVLLILGAIWLGAGLLAGVPLLGLRIRARWRDRS
jgi:hypothetical protein